MIETNRFVLQKERVNTIMTLHNIGNHQIKTEVITSKPPCQCMGVHSLGVIHDDVSTLSGLTCYHIMVYR